MQAEQLVKKIGQRLVGINREVLTIAERQIADLLISNKVLAYDEHNNLVAPIEVESMRAYKEGQVKPLDDVIEELKQKNQK